MRVSSRTSTPRASSWALAYSRSFGWNGPSSCGAISTSRTCTRDGSTSGKVAASTVPRSSASVPASSTPVAPPPTTVTYRSPLIHAEPLEARHQMVAEHDGVGPGVEAERVLRRALDAVERGRHAGGQDEVVVAQVVAVGELDPAGRRVDRGQLPAPVDRPVPPGEAAGRVGDVARVQPGGGDLVEQRLEGAVQVAVHQGHPQPCAGQPGDGGQAAEPRAADDHVRSVRVSLTSSRDRPHLRPPPRCRYWSRRFSTYSWNARRSCSVYGGGARLRGHSR